MTDSTRPSPTSPAPSPAAYTATVTAFDAHTSACTGAPTIPAGIALDGLRIPITLDGTSRLTPIAQAEVAIQDATRETAGGETCAVLWRDHDCGTLHVMHEGHFVPVAALELTPARQQAEVAA